AFCRTATRPQYRAGVAADVSAQGRLPGAWPDGEERTERISPTAMYPPRAHRSANGDPIESRGSPAEPSKSPSPCHRCQEFMDGRSVGRSSLRTSGEAWEYSARSPHTPTPGITGPRDFWHVYMPAGPKHIELVS